MTADGKLISGAGKAYDSGRGADYSGRERLMTADGGAFCVRFVFFLFMKAILSFFDFWTIFCFFFFSFHFCFDLPQVSNC